MKYSTLGAVLACLISTIFWGCLFCAFAENPSYLEKFQISNDLNLTGRILFSARIESHEHILMLDLDAKRVRKLIDSPGNSSYPSWAPNGMRFTFTSDRDGKKQIYLADWDGANQKRLTKSTVNDDNSSWSANGQKVVFYREQDKDTTNLLMLDPDRPVAETLTELTGRNTTPRWSPDNQSVAYSTDRFWPGWDICVWNLFHKTEKCPLSGGQTYCRPAFSPNGQNIAYSYGAFDEIDIAVLDLDNQRQTRVTSLPGREYDAVYTGDGKHLVFVAENGKKDLFNIYVKDLAGKTPLVLLKAPFSLRYLSWSGVKTMELEAKRVLQAEQIEKSHR